MSFWEKRKQTEVLIQEFKCIRLHQKDEHKTLIQGFNSSINPNLAWNLKRNAWFEDNSNYRAYFLVREKNKIVLYFSLQCGLLFKCHEKELDGIIHKEVEGKAKYYIREDVLDVTKVVPGVELCHFCVNDSYRRRKKAWTVKHGILSYTVGAYVFYQFIAPKVIEISKTAGAQFLYLFCADDGSRRLMDYYVNILNFSIMDDMACVRSNYDSGLKCLTIKIEKLQEDLAAFEDMVKVNDLLDFLHSNGTVSVFQANRECGIRIPDRMFSQLVKHGYATIVGPSEHGKINRISAKK